MPFSLETYVKTQGRSGNKRDITPQKFNVNDIVVQVNAHTGEPLPGKMLIREIIWYAETWFCRVHPIVGQIAARIPINNSRACIPCSLSVLRKKYRI